MRLNARQANSAPNAPPAYISTSLRSHPIVSPHLSTAYVFKQAAHTNAIVSSRRQYITIVRLISDLVHLRLFLSLSMGYHPLFASLSIRSLLYLYPSKKAIVASVNPKRLFTFALFFSCLLSSSDLTYSIHGSLPCFCHFLVG